MRFDDDGLLNELAAVGQRIWCHAMQAEGWRHGTMFDYEARTHPHLMPYESLALERQALLQSYLRYDDLLNTLGKAIDLANDIEEWTIADMAVGRRVRFFDVRTPDPMTEPLGRILDWEEDPGGGGRLASFRVQWNDGEIGEYEASAVYIVPAE